MRWCSRLAACVLLSLRALPAVAQMTGGAYRAALQGAVNTARQAAMAPSPRAAALTREARRRLPVKARVTFASGLSVAVANTDLARSLDRALRPRLALGAGHLARSRQAPSALIAPSAALRRFVDQGETLLAALGDRPAGRTGQELPVLQRVLARSEFGPSPLEEWERGVREWLQAFLRRLFGNVQPAALDLVANILYYLVWALLVLLLAYLIWTYVPGLRLRRRGRVAQWEAAGAVTAPERADAHLEQAEAAARAGRYLEALRHTYVAMLLLLDAAERVPYDPSRTNWELLRALRGAAHAPIRDLLSPITRLVDEKLYGGRMATERDYDGCRDACARLKGLLVS